MMGKSRLFGFASAVFAVLGVATAGSLTIVERAAAAEVNIYSSRHYDTDKKLYDDFTEQTGIKVNLIEGSDDELIERLRNEGGNSPADLLITVDAGRLWRAQNAGILDPIRNERLEAAIPAHLREPKGHWFGLSKRARILIFNPEFVKREELSTYEDLADPKWKGRLLVRSSTSVYNQSLVGSMLAAHGEKVTEDWAKGIVANMARKPQGGDTDQIRAVAAGEGDVAVSNSYYFGRLMGSKKPEDRAAAEKLEVFFPNQGDRGTHVNISGAGVIKHAPNKENAVKFLEYLVGPTAQALFSNDNYEYPIVAGVPVNPVVAAWGTDFKEDKLNAAVYGESNAEALMVMDRAGWK